MSIPKQCLPYGVPNRYGLLLVFNEAVREFQILNVAAGGRGVSVRDWAFKISNVAASSGMSVLDCALQISDVAAASGVKMLNSRRVCGEHVFPQAVVAIWGT